MLAEEVGGVSGFARALEFAAQTLLLQQIRYFWRKRQELNPPGTLTHLNGFEGRAPHRRRYSSATDHRTFCAAQQTQNPCGSNSQGKLAAKQAQITHHTSSVAIPASEAFGVHAFQYVNHDITT